jgi:L-iditol 2-dehydrogenase
MMKAVVKSKKGVGFVELLDVPKPQPGPNEVLVEVRAAGICGTDIHIYHDGLWKVNRPLSCLGLEA